MRVNVFISIILSFLFLSGCDHTKEARSDFLNRANVFWKLAASNNYSEIKEMVRYPVLMDGMGIDNDKKFQSRCNAIYTSAKYREEKTGISPDNSSFTIYESGWLKQEVLENHPLLKTHTGNDVSFFLLEVVSNSSKGQPITFIFRRDYEDSNGNWDIIMLEDYSLTEMMKKK